MSATNYVPLSRRFLDGSSSDFEDEADSIWATLPSEERGETWEKILENDISVLLGTAGSGKTTEVRQQVQVLEEAGENAFLLILGKLQDRSTDNAFDFELDGQSVRFKKWKPTGEGGVLFLDALDEARLPSAPNKSALENALDVVSMEIGRRKSRLRLVVTSRPSEWFGDRDERNLKLFIKRTRYTKHDGPTDEPSLKVLRMGALNTTDIEKLAKSRGVNPHEFLEAVNANLSSGIIQQPLDAHLFLDVWKKAEDEGLTSDQIFNSRRQVMHELVNWRLIGRSESRGQVDIDIPRARRAVAKLAAFVVVSDQQDLPAQELPVREVSVAQILSTDETPWTEVQVRSLLVCGLFQPSVGGRIRFAHRELRDFLAAEYFDGSMRSRAHSEQPISVLFADGIGPRTIPQSTENVMGWLSTFNARAREIVLKIRPALLIETGDSQVLSLADKGMVLRNYVKLYDTRKHRGEWFYHDDIRRLAHSDLSSIVEELLDKSSSPELTDFLIKVARFGAMKPLASKLASYVTDPDIGYRTMGEACSALFEIGDTDHRASVLEFALTAECPDTDDTDAAPNWNMFQLKVLQYCYDEASWQKRTHLLSRIQREPFNRLSATPKYLIEVFGELDVAEKRYWLSILLDFAFDGRSKNRFREPIISERYRRFVPAIIFLASVLVSREDTSPDDPNMLDAIEIALGDDDTSEIFGSKAPIMNLVDGIRQNLDLKHGLLERRNALFSDRERPNRVPLGLIRTLETYDKSENGEIFEKHDVLHCCKLADEEPDQSKRAYLLDLAGEIRTKLEGSDRSDVDAIYSRYLRKLGDDEQRSRFGIRWIIRRWFLRARKMYRYDVKDWLGNQIDRLKKKRTVRKTRRAVGRRKQNILAGDICLKEAQLLLRIPRGELVSGTMKSVSEYFGDDIAEMFRTGMREYWKAHDTCYAERKANLGVIGLAGISLDHSLGDLPTDINLVRKAFRFSFHEVNSFPVWVEDLARKFPVEFCLEMQCALADDFSKPEVKGYHYTSNCISMIAYSSNHIRNSISPTLLKMMMKSLPENLRDRMLCLDIVARATKPEPNCLSRFLVSGFHGAWKHSDFREAWVWLDALLNADSKKARNILETYFADLEGVENKDLFFEFLGRDEDKPSLEFDADLVKTEYQRDPFLLEWLARAAFLVWPPEKDVVHDTVYSPGKADHAASNRRGYVSLLGAIHTVEAYEALCRLANSKELKDYRDEFLFWLDGMYRVEGRRQKLSPTQTIDFLNDHSKAPSSVEEFRKLCNTHIEALLKQLHQSDDDEGAYYRRGGAREDDLRNWMAARLRDVGEHYYTVIREQEVAGEKRTDIRLYSQTDSLGNVSVEIKLANMKHWSGDQLVNTPDEQISRRYLLEPSSHTGIYVLVNAAIPGNKAAGEERNIKRKEFSKKVGGTSVNFENLVKAVEEECRRVNDRLEDDKVVSLIARDISEKPSETI